MASRRSIEAGRAYVELFMKDNKYTRGLRMAAKKLQQFGGQVNRISKRMAAVSAGLLGAGLAAAKSFAAVGDQLHKANLRLKVSVETLSQLRMAAEWAGTSFETVTQAIAKMNRRVGRMTAGFGSKSQVAAIEELGLSLEDLARMKPEEQFFALADAIANYGDMAQAAGLAQRAFGTQIDALLPLFADGAKGIRKMMREADRLGHTMSQEDANAAAEFADAMTSAEKAVKLVVIALGKALAGPYQEFSEWITSKATELTKFIQKHHEWAEAAVKVTAKVALLTPVVWALGKAIRAVGIGVALLQSPFILATAAATGFAAAALKVSGRWEETVQALEQDTARLSNGIIAALKAGEIENAFAILGKNLQIGWTETIRGMELQFQRFMAERFRKVEEGADKAKWFPPMTGPALIAGGLAKWGRGVSEFSIAEIEQEIATELGALEAERSALKATIGKAKAVTDAATGGIIKGLLGALPSVSWGDARKAVGTAVAVPWHTGMQLSKGARSFMQRMPTLEPAMARASQITQGTFSGEAASRLGGAQAWQTSIVQQARDTKNIARDMHDLLGEVEQGGMLVGAS